ncbi:MAG: aldehyde dehydrogenase family protein, partial [Candidatus Omnitrophica bacterium]|nr:aldehyde dehydrogenase family protein [Candidatus Omnitrophota bacterium]
MTNSELKIKNIIGGKSAPSFSGQTFLKRDPLRNRPLYRVPNSSDADIRAAIKRCKTAALSWNKFPIPKKGEIFFKVAVKLKDHQVRLSHLMTGEMGKPLAETAAEVQEAIDTANYFAGEGRRFFGRTIPSEMQNRQCMTFRRPVGICGLITPWNFPLAVPTWKIFPALLCGNTVIWKPSEEAPATANALMEILLDSGVPADSIHLIHGTGKGAGNSLVESQDVSLISFTGSSVTGAGIAAKCAFSHKRFSLEMGGKNAQIIMPDADLENAVNGAIWGSFGTSGQRCTATSRIIVHRKVYAAFLKKFSAQAGRLGIGSGYNSGTTLGPIINNSQITKIKKFVMSGKKEARLVLGGEVFHSKEFPKGRFYKPTIFADVNPSGKLAQEEIFGPVALLIPCQSLDEAIEIANNSRFGLSSSIYTGDLTSA